VSVTRCHAQGMTADVASAPKVGLRQAAELCGCSIATVRRRKAGLIEHGAVQTKDGWRIPVPALVTLGLLDRQSPPDKSVSPRSGNAKVTPDEVSEVARLTALLAQEHTLRMVAEAIAEERGRTLEHMRAIAAAPAPAPAGPIPMPAAPSADPAPVRHWWLFRS
jgi:hypothetical protein